ncbi:hypothetical protein SAMN05216266_110210 [Amycolatopsis marina]|uniref:Uncharacterized protein n=1 Tax=Amycolatopsis marina TaxID=490629 RepID=A0A1I1AZU8_9PSEU|nr:hypothetical protein [Amycolatopsis marina]SFB41880.1 hypothetical protein SAMN05216266_110210 [Amycolatopsis marina]
MDNSDFGSDKDGVIDQEHHFPFVVDPRFARLLTPLHLDRKTSGVRVGWDGLSVRFGPWHVHSPLTNIAGASVTGPFSALRAIGTRVSLMDRGLTFGTNTLIGVCIDFHRPVRGVEPLGVLRHPALTVTVAEPQLLARWLRSHATAPGA